MYNARCCYHSSERFTFVLGAASKTAESISLWWGSDVLGLGLHAAGA